MGCTHSAAVEYWESLEFWEYNMSEETWKNLKHQFRNILILKNASKAFSWKTPNSYIKVFITEYILKMLLKLDEELNFCRILKLKGNLIIDLSFII